MPMGMLQRRAAPTAVRPAGRQTTCAPVSASRAQVAGRRAVFAQCPGTAGALCGGPHRELHR
jgi:hypothetical protein